MLKFLLKFSLGASFSFSLQAFSLTCPKLLSDSNTALVVPQTTALASRINQPIHPLQFFKVISNRIFVAALVNAIEKEGRWVSPPKQVEGEPLPLPSAETLKFYYFDDAAHMKNLRDIFKEMTPEQTQQVTDEALNTLYKLFLGDLKAEDRVSWFQSMKEINPKELDATLQLLNTFQGNEALLGTALYQLLREDSYFSIPQKIEYIDRNDFIKTQSIAEMTFLSSLLSGIPMVFSMIFSAVAFGEDSPLAVGLVTATSFVGIMGSSIFSRNKTRERLRSAKMATLNATSVLRAHFGRNNLTQLPSYFGNIRVSNIKELEARVEDYLASDVDSLLPFEQLDLQQEEFLLGFPRNHGLKLESGASILSDLFVELEKVESSLIEIMEVWNKIISKKSLKPADQEQLREMLKSIEGLLDHYATLYSLTETTLRKHEELNALNIEAIAFLKQQMNLVPKKAVTDSISAPAIQRSLRAAVSALSLTHKTHSQIIERHRHTTDKIEWVMSIRPILFRMISEKDRNLRRRESLSFLGALSELTRWRGSRN